MKVEAYLFFDGRCEEALEFYKQALGAEVTMLMRFRESPEPPTALPAGAEEKVMHAAFRVGESNVMASDGQCLGKPDFRGFALSLTARDVADAERLFAVLAAGGQIQMPLAETFFSPRFGMVTDRFGVAWMVIVAAA